MGTIARGAKAGGGTGYNSGQTIDPAEVNTDFNTVYTEINGELDDANVKTAEMPGSKSFRFTEISAPSNPGANDLLLYGKDSGAGRSLLYSHDSGGLAIPLGILTWEAFGIAESTTATGAAADIKTITVSLPVTDGALIMAALRKTSGAVAACTVGLKVNSTQVFANTAWATGANAVANALFVALIWRSGNSSHFGSGYALTSSTDAAGVVHRSVGTLMPGVAITGFTITGSSIDAAVTMGVADVVVYRLQALGA